MTVVLIVTFRIRTSLLDRLVHGAMLATVLLPARAMAADSPSQAENRPGSQSNDGSLSVGILAGWSHGDEQGYAGFRTLFGYGGRAGYRFADSRLYLGVTVMGYSDEIREAPEYGGMLYGTEHLIYTDIEVGAEYSLAHVTLRPYLGLGMLTAIYDAPPNSGSGLGVALVPGLHARYPWGPVYVGADVRFELGSNPSGALLGCAGFQLGTGR